MDYQHFNNVQDLFHRGLALDPTDRTAFLDAACAHDVNLRREVARLLEADEQMPEVLVHDPGQLASGLLSSIGSIDGIDPYRIIRPIGEGGMGSVFLAERTDIGKQVALKLLRDAWLSPARRRRFAEEQRTLASLEHPAIARLYDAGSTADGTPWIAMEFVDGEPLTTYAARQSIDDRLRLFSRVCEAVQFAHTRLVVHRDLKPSNIFVTNNGDVKLLDFGIARSIAKTKANSRQTRTVLTLVTPAYAAPEQLRGGTADVRSDVYSLGIVLFELLTGQLPSSHSDTHDQPSAPRELPRPSSMRPATSATNELHAAAWNDLDVLCMTAGRLDPQRRYATVDALRADVDRYLRGLPLAARPDTLGYRTAKFLGRNRRAVAASTFGLAVAAIISAIYVANLNAAREQAELEAHRAEVAAKNADLEASRSKRVTELMLSMMGDEEDLAGPGESLRVVEVLDRGARELHRLDDEPEIKQTMTTTVGKLYSRLGQLDRATELLESAVEQATVLYPERHTTVVETMLELAMVKAEREDYDAAIHIAQDAIARVAASPDRYSELHLRGVGNLGLILISKGDYRLALDQFQSMSDRIELAHPSDPLNLLLRGRALARFYLGELDDADKGFRESMAMTMKLHGPHHAHVAEDHLSLGAVYRERERYDLAHDHFEQAFEITRDWYGEDSVATARAANKIGRNLNSLERYDEAKVVLTRTLETMERLLGPNHTDVALVINELAWTADGMNDFDGATALYRRALEIQTTVHDQGHYYVGIAHSNLASALAKQDLLTEAESEMRAALKVYAGTLPDTHANVGIAKIKLGHVLRRIGRHDEAEALINAAVAALRGVLPEDSVWFSQARENLAAVYAATGREAMVSQLDGQSPSPTAPP